MTYEETMAEIQRLRAENAAMQASKAEGAMREANAAARREARRALAWEAWGSNANALRVESYKAPASHGLYCVVVRKAVR